MIAIDFGHLSFNTPASEQNILVVLAPKSSYSSMDEFVSEALKYLESDGDFCDNWTQMYKDRTYIPADENEIKFMKSCIESMNTKVNILCEPIETAVYVIPPEWNDITLGIETKTYYIFYLWSTSA